MSSLPIRQRRGLLPSVVLLRSYLQRLDFSAFGYKVRSRWHLAKWFNRQIVYVVVDKEQVAARAGRDVAIGPMQSIAVKQHYRTGGAGGHINALALKQFLQASLVRYAQFLFAQ